MSEPSPSSRHSNSPARPLAVDWGRALLVVFLLLGAAFFLQSAFRHFMYDDEGGYAYAAWRISLGEVPYRDLLTPQMPGFLYWGALIVRLFGRSFVALRIPSLAAMLGAACLLYAINRQVFGRAVALTSLGLFLVGTNVFHNARFYRPEAYMLLLNLAGLYCLLQSERRGRPHYLWLAGLFFGVAITFKLFALLALAGCYLYLLYAGWRERRPLSAMLRHGVALGLPAALVVGVVAAVFYRITPYFIVAVLEHHTMQGAGLTLLERLGKGLRFFREYAWYQPVLVLLFGWGAFSLRRQKPLATVLAWQVPTVLSFFVLSRSLMTRHLTYLEPTFATLMALALMGLLQGRWRLPLLREAWHYQTLALVLTCLALWPGAKLTAVDSNQRDIEPLKLAEVVQALTSPDEAVMADYPGINFAAGRRTTYWAAGISGGAAESGQITGAALVKEIQTDNVGMVIINTRYGAHQMTEMHDYADFRRFVQAHYYLVDKYHCAYQQLELYARGDTMPLQPRISFQNQLALTGVRLPAQEVKAGSKLSIDTRWQALGPMPRDYHVSLRLADATGRPWAQLDEPLQEEFSHREPGIYWDVTDRFRPTRWAVGQVVLQEHVLELPTAVPAGRYYLVARVYDLDSGYALVSRAEGGRRLPGGDTIVGTVQVRARGPVATESLAMEHRLDLEAAPGLQLLGCGLLPGSIKAGRDLGVALYWRVQGEPGNVRLEYRLVEGGAVRQRWVEPIADGPMPQGQVYLGGDVLALSDELAGGQYGLELQVLDASGQALGQALSLGELTVAPRPDRATVLQGLAQRLEGIRFGEGIGLLGYTIGPGKAESGGVTELVLYWECLAPVGNEYKVFTHLLDGTGAIQGQRDDIPEAGAAPTSTWQVGDVIVDRYEIPVSAEARGALQVEIGLYEPLTGARLPLQRDGQPTGEDHLILPTAVMPTPTQ
ncbi:MAG: ArnT family glycosyltransferase [Anaerolineae bacterium]